MGRYSDSYHPSHPLANRNGHVPVHRAVLYEKIGPGTHPCHWCSLPVTWTPGGYTRQGVLVVDHVNNDRGDNTPENLVPSCHRCNARRGHPQNIGDTEPYILMKGSAGRHRAVERICKCCGDSFLALAADKRPNHGQFCSRSCARRFPYQH